MSLAEACLRIRNLPEFKELREYLDKQQALSLNVLTSSQDDRAMYTAQGAWRQIQALKDLIEKSADVLDKQRGTSSSAFL